MPERSPESVALQTELPSVRRKLLSTNGSIGKTERTIVHVLVSPELIPAFSFPGRPLKTE